MGKSGKHESGDRAKDAGKIGKHRESQARMDLEAKRTDPEGFSVGRPFRNRTDGNGPRGEHTSR